MKWLITGGCGFIGKNLVKKLHTDPCNKVRIVDNLSAGTNTYFESLGKIIPNKTSELNWERSLQLVVANVTDYDVALLVTKNADIIIHLAANTGVEPSVKDPRTDMFNNVVGTFNYLDASHKNKVSRFVFASSGAPVGEVTPPIHEELHCKPKSPYGASKLSGEAYCSAYAQTFDLETVALRFGNVYGPGSLHKQSVVSKFFKKAINGDTIEIYGDGNQTRDFIFVDDLVNAVVKASTVKNIGGHIFQIATQSETTIVELVKEMISILNELGVNNFKVKNSESRTGDVKRNYSDTSKAKKYLNWQCKHNLQQGLLKVAKSFMKEMN